MILTRFKSCGIVISYADIARVARQEDRRTLAAQLLEHEVLVEDQVQMLLEMNEADKALDKATSSWDAQLGNYCLYIVSEYWWIFMSLRMYDQLSLDLNI